MLKAIKFTTWIVEHVLQFLNEIHLNAVQQLITYAYEEDKRGYVYVITCHNIRKMTIYKIGKSEDIQKRLISLNSSILPQDRMTLEHLLYA
jgi:hypothetical protein